MIVRPWQAVVSFSIAVFAIAAAFPLTVGAEQKLDAYGLPLPDVEDPASKWKEEEVSLPAFPHEDTLLAVPLPSRDRIKLYVDTDSIRIGEDGVARMTLIVVGGGGARNVFHEGLRCATREHKTYAYGTADRRLAPMPDARWQDLPNYEVNNYLRALFVDYVCGSDIFPRTKRDIVRRMTHGASSTFIGDDY